MEHQYIGILISSLFFKGIKWDKKNQILSFYEEAAKEYDVTPCFLRLGDLTPGKQQVRGYILNSSGKYVLTTIPKPLVIHNRGYQSTKAQKNKIKSLQKDGIIIFNEWNRYGKLQIHELLISNEEINPHLPETILFNSENMMSMMKKHNELIIKPSSGTLGKRNMKATYLKERNWQLHYPYKDRLLEEILPNEHLPMKIITLGATEKFIIQKRIALAEFNQNPFDIRVSVQRNEKGEWQVTGMVGKVAKTGSFLTNVARGGSCLPLNEIINNLPHLDYEQVHLDIERLSIKIAKELGKQFASLGDIGLDIGLTNEGFPMFIECNARDLRVTFRNANLPDVWKLTYKTPIGYGKYLLNLLNGQ